MKRLLLTSFLLGLIPSANAADTCNFVSEYYPELTIEVINGEYNLIYGECVCQDQNSEKSVR